MKRIAPCLGLAVSFLAYPYYVQPSASIDKDHVQLAARFNYENFETLSLWMGWKFSGDKHVSWTVTPSIGSVFGRTTGIAAGLDVMVSWWQVFLDSQSEYVIDAIDLSKSFLYNWTELGMAPIEWVRFGAVLQRTRLRHQARDVEPGFFAGVIVEHVMLTGYVFAPGEGPPTVVLAFTVKR